MSASTSRPARAAGSGLDVRLAVGAASAWLAILLCSGCSPTSIVGLAGVGAALGAGGVVAAGRNVRCAAGLSFAAFSCALVLVPLAGRVAHQQASPLAALARSHTAVTAELTVAGDPRPLAAKGVAGAPRAEVPTKAGSVSVGGRRLRVDGSVLVLGPADAWRGVVPGQRVRVDGVLQPSLDAGALSVTMFSCSPRRRCSGNRRGGSGRQQMCGPRCAGRRPACPPRCADSCRASSTVIRPISTWCWPSASGSPVCHISLP